MENILEKYQCIAYRGSFTRWGKFCVGFALYEKKIRTHTYYEIDFELKSEQVEFENILEYWNDKQEITEEIISWFDKGDLNEVAKKAYQNLFLLQEG